MLQRVQDATLPGSVGEPFPMDPLKDMRNAPIMNHEIPPYGTTTQNYINPEQWSTGALDLKQEDLINIANNINLTSHGKNAINSQFFPNDDTHLYNECGMGQEFRNKMPPINPSDGFEPEDLKVRGFFGDP